MENFDSDVLNELLLQSAWRTYLQNGDVADVLYARQSCEKFQRLTETVLASADKEALDRALEASQGSSPVEQADGTFVIVYQMLVWTSIVMLTTAACWTLRQCVSSRKAVALKIRTAGRVSCMFAGRPRRSSDEKSVWNLECQIGHQQMVEHNLLCSRVCLPLFASLLLINLLDAMTSIERDRQIVPPGVLSSNLATYCTFCGLSLIGAMFPHRVTSRYIEVAHVLVTAQLVFTIASQSSWLKLRLQHHVCSVLRCCVAVLHAKRRFVVTLNGVYTIAYFVVLHSFIPAGYDVWKLADDIVDQIFVSLLICFLSETLQRSRERMVHATVEAKLGGRVEVAVERLLSSVCDAVVHTNSDFQVQKSHGLEDLLLLSQGANEPRSQSIEFFSHFLSASDVTTLQKAWRGNDDGHVHSVYMKLRDASASAVNVQLFHTGYLDAQDQTQHLICIRKCAEDSTPAGAIEKTLPVSKKPEDDNFSRSSGGDTGPTAKSDIAMWVDAGTAELTILKTTHELRSFVWPFGSHRGLIDFIPQRQKDDFDFWFQEQTNNLEDDTAENSEAQNAYWPITFRPQKSKQALHANLRVESCEESETCGSFIVKLSLEDIRQDDRRESTKPHLIGTMIGL
eukprot:TRINITY_DN94725_c0_g1_i1.p1 TRINITY_DN94725_c0_g1~~TRINITY_DN94725_c0_g1_i1.p1  ORF type:complete len:624 (+),score=83.21 TRINITY_DN94725_c0_g1_i1:41-1912(+)